MEKMDLLYFIDFVCDVLTVEINKIWIKENGKLYNPINKYDKTIEAQEAKARFLIDSNGNNILWLDLDRHDNYEEFLSILHELRHGYQLSLVYDSDYDITNDREAQIWQYEIENYIPFGQKGYENQQIEIDANAFVIYMAEYLFGIKVNHEYDDVIMENQIDIIAEDLFYDEIIDCKERSRFDFAKYSKKIRSAIVTSNVKH